MASLSTDKLRNDEPIQPSASIPVPIYFTTETVIERLDEPWGIMERIEVIQPNIATDGVIVKVYRVTFYKHTPHNSHFHPDDLELLTVEKNAIDQIIDGHRYTLRAKQQTAIPPRAVHSAAPVDGKTTVVLVTLIGPTDGYVAVDVAPETCPTKPRSPK